jgi:hypothetical protein
LTNRQRNVCGGKSAHYNHPCSLSREYAQGAAASDPENPRNCTDKPFRKQTEMRRRKGEIAVQPEKQITESKAQNTYIQVAHEEMAKVTAAGASFEF